MTQHVSRVMVRNVSDYERQLMDHVYGRIKDEKQISWHEFQEKDFPNIIAQLNSRNPEKNVQNDKFIQRRFPTVVIKTLAQYGQTDRLVDFVHEYGIENLSISQIALFICHCQCTETVSKAWKHLAAKKNTLFNSDATLNLVEGLCRTEHWRDAIQLVTNLSEVSKPLPSTFSPLIAKLFAEGFDDEAFKWLDLFYSEQKFSVGLEAEVALSSLNNAKRLFQLAADHCIGFQRDVLTSPALESLFRVTFTRIGTSSRCPICKTILPAAKHLTSEELQMLQTAIHDRIIKRDKNIFLTTTPNEYDSFKKFIQKKGPFDVVIDGLNIGYRLNKNAVAEEAKRLAKEENKRVLILGRRHMLRWPGMNDLPRQVALYTTADLSKDDPFILIASLYSHSECNIVSSDMFYDHRARLSEIAQRCIYDHDVMVCSDIRRLFNRWLYTHQQAVGAKPLAHDVTPQEDSKGWHVPVHVTRAEQAGVLYRTHWACLRRI